MSMGEVMVRGHVKFLVRHVAPPVDVTSLVHSCECAPTNDVTNDVILQFVVRNYDVRLRP